MPAIQPRRGSADFGAGYRLSTVTTPIATAKIILLTILAMARGQGYSARHQERSDYYAGGERVIGQWQARGAEMLDLSGEVKSHQFEVLLQAHQERYNGI